MAEVCKTLTYHQTLDALDEHFATHEFSLAGGNMQSMVFTLHTLMQLSAFEAGRTLTQRLAARPSVVHEYGCAEGDGTAMFQTFFPNAHVIGFDLSVEAIRNAVMRWPTITFKIGDWHDPRENAHVIFMSHCFEQMDDPIAVVRKMQDRCHLLLATMSPLRDDPGGKRLHEWLRDGFGDDLAAAHGAFTTARQVPLPGKQVVYFEDTVLLLIRGRLEDEM